MKKILTLFAFTTLVLSFTGCKDESDVGLALQDNDDLLNTTLVDTLTLELSSVLYNEKNESDSSYVLIVGSYDDVNTGKTTAQSYFQLVPDFNRGGVAVDGAVFDSAALQLQYYVNSFGYPSIYGDTTASFNISLNELGSTLTSKDYITSETVATEATNLLTKTAFNVTPYTNSIFSLTIDPVVGQQLFDSSIDSLTFLNSYPGFSLSSPDAKSIVGFASDFTSTEIVLYFHTTDNPTTTLTTTLVTSANTVRFNNITGDFTGSKLSSLQQSGDNVVLNDEVYLKNGVGIGLNVGLPSFATFLDSANGNAVNKAEIVLSLVGDYSTVPTYPSEFISAYYSSLSEFTPTLEDGELKGVDLDNSSSSSIQVNSEDGTYTLNITSYIQDMIIGKEDANDLFLFPFGNASLVNNTAIAGPDYSDETKRPQLKIYLTK